MSDRDELMALRRLAELEAKAAGQPKYDPSEGGGTLSFGPWDTGIKTPQWLDRTLAGAGKAFADTGRGVGQMVGLVGRDDVAESRRLDAPLMNTGAGVAGNILGNVALTAPVALVPGANTIGGGALVGAGMGLIQPSTSGDETLKNTVTGGVAGAAVPALVRGYRFAKSAAEPFYQAGRDRILGRALNSAAGDDAAAVAARLAQSSEPFVGPTIGAPPATMGEIVPGSVPTVAQRAQNAGIAALERAATANSPEVTNAIATRAANQNAARTDLLGRLAGADGARDFAVANRDATAEMLYGSARRLGVDPQAMTPEALQNIARFSQRIPDSILAKARQLAQISGTPMTDATSVEGLHWIKKALDGAIAAKGEAGLDPVTRGALVGLQQDLLTGLDAISPAYGEARRVYAAMSRPVNQMEVAQDIADRSINRLTGNIQPNALANAVTDRTAARVTGMPRATLDSVMEPAQVNQLAALLDDVRGSVFAQNAGRGPGSDTVQKLAYTNMLGESGVPTFLQNFAPAQVFGNMLSRSADVAYGRANRELAQQLAEVMLDPSRAAQVMRMATPAQRTQIAALLTRSGQASALAAPIAANALQQ